MFRGTGTAMITPFKNGAVDYEAMERFFEFQIDGGVDALIVLGTTGEAATLTVEERAAVTKFAVAHVHGRVPVILGTGSNCTATTIETTKNAMAMGADGVLTVTPFYNKPTQEGLYQHFKAIAEATHAPMILYNVPGRTGVNMLPETVLRLADIPNIVGVKEASGNQYQCDSLILRMRVKRKDFRIFSGNDDQAFHMVCAGGDGVVSVLSNVMPAETSAMMGAALDGDLATARTLHMKLLTLMKDLFCETNPIPVKYAVSRLGYCENELRLPLVPATAHARELVDADLLELGLVK